MEGSFTSEYLLPGTLALIMLGMGLSLTVNDFRNILHHPKGLITGLVCQIICLPLIAFGIASAFDLSNELKVGMVIIAACPGGATSNLITHLLKGRLALSISLTAFNSFITIITIPVIVNLALIYFMGTTTEMQMPVVQTIVRIFLITIVPTSLGMLIRRYRKKFAKASERPLRYIMPVLLGIVFTVAIMGQQQENSPGFTSIYLKVIPPTLLLNVIGMLFGYFSGYLIKLGKANKLTLSIEVGIQNSALAITIASSAMFLNNYSMAIPAVVYGLFTFFNAILIGYILKKASK